jgi:hypothetical protein
MADGPASISSLQRTARMTHARDEAHYRLLRAGELLARRRQLGRWIVTAVMAAAALGVIVTAMAAARDGSEPRGAAPRIVAAPLVTGSGLSQTLVTGTGDERIDAGGGDDVVFTGPGDDVAFGSGGNDVLHGGPGDDVLWAGPGRDVLLGADGDDELRAPNLDGVQDRLHCGPGVDVAWVVSRAGRIEDRTFGCERVVVVEVRKVRPARR